ncbi:MAG: type II toxin-antitoxin system RelE/ParE family toxin [Candidatus Bathyarchaeota archaeon]|nr:type II toxin-antitoxin system RelE/ParE family toxin [Candidatus Bathyarchaeum tardum]WGM89933.1 MAG: type II toxin-antitoxin system RelE/ParE family toxin [Candidatus Bathyarchaeum tardum]
MTYKVLLHPNAAKTLSKTQEKTRIINKLKQLKTNPQKTGKPVKLSEYYRLRIGDYSAIYEIDQIKKQVILLYIGHSKNVYDDFSKLL